MAKKTFIICVMVFAGIFAFTNQSWAADLWFEDWEGNWSDDWYPETGTWEVGVPTSGPGSAYSGENCAATVLGGNYPVNAQSRLIRIDPFTVPGAGQNPRLRFQHWYRFGSNASGQVQIKTDGGSWEPISPSYSGSSGGIWTRPYIDLSPYAGQSVQIAFYFSSANYSTDVGWYIDDVEIYPLAAPEFKIDIKVNGSDGTVVVRPSDYVLVTVELEDGQYTDTPADWWIGAASTIGTYWYNSTGDWVPSNTPILYSQDPLHDIPETTLLNMQLPVGVYTFFFVLDDNQDGNFNITVRDHVNVFVRKP